MVKKPLVSSLEANPVAPINKPKANFRALHDRQILQIPTLKTIDGNMRTEQTIKP